MSQHVTSEALEETLQNRTKSKGPSPTKRARGGSRACQGHRSVEREERRVPARRHGRAGGMSVRDGHRHPEGMRRSSTGLHTTANRSSRDRGETGRGKMASRGQLSAARCFTTRQGTRRAEWGRQTGREGAQGRAECHQVGFGGRRLRGHHCAGWEGPQWTPWAPSEFTFEHEAFEFYLLILIGVATAKDTSRSRGLRQAWVFGDLQVVY